MDSIKADDVVDVIEIERIKELIPHRYPMLLIDRMIDVVTGKRATGIKNVSVNEPFFQGHFPDQPVMPGVLIVEAMAQTSAALVVHTLGKEAEGKLVYFMSISNARFRKPVTPGDVMHIHVERETHRRNVWKFKSEAKVDGVTVADATYTAMIRDV
jgi:3-hydroxyacyl-[acyl-carrier-protein] dehydratase